MRASESVTVVDAHVHVHPGTDACALLDAAASNLSAAAQRAGALRWHGILMLAEMRGMVWFEKMRETAEPLGRWVLQPVPGDPASLSAIAPGSELTIIAGRQVVTDEGIEVLTLATRARIDDGLALDATLAAGVENGGLVVLPWGAGKWLGARGRLVAAAVARRTHAIFVGDNGGRPHFWPEPRVFRAARAAGRPILPGTDPLPLPREERRVGSFGFMLEGAPAAVAPSRSLRECLLNAAPDAIASFGRLQSSLKFLSNQVGLRLRKPAHSGSPTQ